MIYSPESKRGQRRKPSPLGRAALAREPRCCLFFKKDSFSARRATDFTPNLLEILFNSGRQAQKNWGKARSWGFYLGKRVGLVPTTKFGAPPRPRFKSEVLEGGGGSGGGWDGRGLQGTTEDDSTADANSEIGYSLPPGFESCQCP